MKLFNSEFDGTGRIIFSSQRRLEEVNSGWFPRDGRGLRSRSRSRSLSALSCVISGRGREEAESAKSAEWTRPISGCGKTRPESRLPRTAPRKLPPLPPLLRREEEDEVASRAEEAEAAETRWCGRGGLMSAAALAKRERRREGGVKRNSH